jgi:transposase
MSMNEQTVRKTYKYKLSPTPHQERELGRVLGLCRHIYNTALEQRVTAWQRTRVSLSRYQQEAELQEVRAALPDYAAIHSHVLQDVLARLDKTYQAFFRRIQRGEKAGFPRVSGAHAPALVHLQRVRQRCDARQQVSDSLQGWTHSRSLVASN